MTTIVWDGKMLCTDSLLTSGDMRFGSAKKVRRLKSGALIAVAGSAWMLDAMAKYIDEGGSAPDFGEETMEMILIEKDGTAYEYAKSHRFPACVPWAGGSGGQFAMAALKCGRDAKGACELACELDVYSGGPVRKYKP